MTNPLKTHLFICTNIKPEGSPSCGARNAGKLRSKVKDHCQNTLSAHKGEFRINASGCLGRCEQGIVAVLYPQGIWFEDLKETDSDTEYLINQVKEVLLAT